MRDRKIFFTGDQHFYHAAILQWTGRPFKHVEEMNEAMINSWNNVVHDGDRVFVLGDFIWHAGERRDRILSRLAGDICLIQGDHDKGLRNCNAVKHLPQLHTIWLGNLVFVLCHWPLREWHMQYHGSIQLHAHCHGRGIAAGRQLDVGVDTHNFTPWTLEEVLETLDIHPEAGNSILRPEHPAYRNSNRLENSNTLENLKVRS